jgi:hypothetical protein
MPRKLGRALVLLAVCAALALLLFPTQSFYRCPLAFVMHVPCPTCGITRATSALLHLDVAGAWHMHPLVFLVVPYLVTLIAFDGWHWVRAGKTGSFLGLRAARVIGFTICALLFATWIARFFGALGGPVSV